MQNTKSHSPNAGVKVVAGLLVASQVTAIAEEANAPAASNEVVETLEPTTVVATKFEMDLKDVSASVAILDVEELRNEGENSVQEAIGHRTPGVIATSTAGQSGQPTSLFIRGTKTNQSQVRLDGVRISDSTASYANFLGSTNLFGLSDIEILKGASSSVYGAGAIGGVLSLSTAKGEGEPTHSATAEYGSYNSWLGNLSSQGAVGDFSYNLGVTGEDTQNDSDSPISGNDFTQFSYYSRFDFALDDHSSIGMTLRGGDSSFETPEYGSLSTNTPQKNRYDYLFGTLFYENQVSDAWSTRVTLGMSKEDFDSKLGKFGDFYSNTDRYSINWDNEYVWSDKHSSVVGTYFENVEFEDTYQVDSSRDSYGIYFSHAWQVIDSVLVNGTLGWDDHDDYGDEWTWNAGAIYELTSTTSFKANSGKGFRAPTFAELTPSPGIPAWFIPATLVDPDLGAEQSFNWNIGVEQVVCGTTLALTWFENDVTNAIQSIDAGASNLRTNVAGKSKVNGLEFASHTELEDFKTSIFTSYTYYQHSLAVEIPEQSATLGINTQITEKCNGGVVGTWVDRRESGGESLGSYTLVNLFTNYQVTENVKVHGRIENLLGEDYELADFTIFGDPNAVKGRGRGFYGGVTVTF